MFHAHLESADAFFSSTNYDFPAATLPSAPGIWKAMELEPTRGSGLSTQTIWLACLLASQLASYHAHFLQR